MLARSTDMWSAKLGCINAVKHRIELALNSCPFCSALYRAGLKVRELKELEVRMQFKADIIEPVTFEWASSVILVPKKDGSFRFASIIATLTNSP